MAPRTLSAGQRTQVLIGSPTLDAPRVLFETTEVLLEAPNWHPDGDSLLLNGDGRLWRLDVHSPERLEPIDFSSLPSLNNDHVVDPDGEHIGLSTEDGHIHRAPLAGGEAVRLTPEDGRSRFLHGISPDGGRLASVEIAGPGEPGRLMVLPRDGDGGPVHLPTGPGHVDGPEWSPDGRWILLNTEAFAETPGHAQLARIPDGGGRLQRLRTSGTVDWFPHLAPNGRWGSFIAFPPRTRGHPADREVVVHVVSEEDWDTPVQSYPVTGGQGTLNVNSWAPDSEHLAFVAYPSAD